MTSRYFLSLTAVASCLYAATAHPQGLNSFDFGRFYVPQNGRTAKGPTNSKEFSIDSTGTLARVADPGPSVSISNYFGSNYRNLPGATAAASPMPSKPDNETDLVRFGTTPTMAPCGPSPASTEEIKTMVVSAANRYSVDPDFALAVTWTESRFDRVRNSPKGARGPMQLMPQTARRFDVADVCDPAANIDGGMRYLRQLLDEFKNPLIAAAAYNAGEQAVYDSGGVPAYPETVRYVSQVINHQFGIPEPIKARSDRQSPVDINDTPTNDVIGARAPKFVSGVMQF